MLSNFNSEAVLDRETGLVWEKTPDSSFDNNWNTARRNCANKNVGGVGRIGWRLPSLAELSSLVDRSNSNPALPTGHPFIGVRSFYYWSATSDAAFPASSAWFVNFGIEDVQPGDKGISTLAWCVRGGMNADAY